jgi:nucleosome binding factor SPN SPT16 subunit
MNPNDYEYDPGNVKRHRRLFEAVKKTEMINLAQKDLLYDKMQELQSRIKLGTFNIEKPEDKRIKLESIVSYSTKQQHSKLASDQIHLDKSFKCLLLPINNRLVPFNIACIKNLTHQNIKDEVLLRVNFQTPVIQTGNLIFPDPKIFGKIPIYVKELSFIVKNVSKILGIIDDFRKLQKEINLEESLKFEKIYPGYPIPSSTKLNTLGGIQIRPPLVGRKTTGLL